VSLISARVLDEASTAAPLPGRDLDAAVVATDDARTQPIRAVLHTPEVSR